MPLKRWAIAHQLFMALAFVSVVASVRGSKLDLAIPMLLFGASSFAWLYPVRGVWRSTWAAIFGGMAILGLVALQMTIGSARVADLMLLRLSSSWLAGGLAIAYGATGAAILVVLVKRVVSPRSAEDQGATSAQFGAVDSEVFQEGIRYEMRILAMLGVIVLLFLAALHFDLIPV